MIQGTFWAKLNMLIRPIAAHFIFLILVIPLIMGGCSSEEKVATRPTKAVRKVKVEQSSEQVSTEQKTASSEKNEFKGYASAKLRDPFLPFLREGAAVRKKKAALTPLEKFDLGELQFVGVLQRGKEVVALVQDNEGKGYTVKKGTKIGRNGGVVSKVSLRELLITEEFVDVYGKKVYKKRKLTLPSGGGK